MEHGEDAEADMTMVAGVQLLSRAAVLGLCILAPVVEAAPSDPAVGTTFYTSTYDKFTDRTIYQSKYLRLETQNFSLYDLYWSLAAISKGASPGWFESVVLTFTHYDKDWQFLDSRRLILLYNGDKRINLGEVHHRGKAKAGGADETMTVVVPLSALRVLASGGSIEGRLGQVEFTTSGDSRTMFREMMEIVDKLQRHAKQSAPKKTPQPKRPSEKTT